MLYPLALLSIPPASSRFSLGVSIAIFIDLFIAYFYYLDQFLPSFLFLLPYIFLLAIPITAALTISYSPTPQTRGQWRYLSSNTIATTPSNSSVHELSRQELVKKLTDSTVLRNQDQTSTTEDSALLTDHQGATSNVLEICPTCIVDKSITSTHCSVSVLSSLSLLFCSDTL